MPKTVRRVLWARTRWVARQPIYHGKKITYRVIEPATSKVKDRRTADNSGKAQHTFKSLSPGKYKVEVCAR